MSSEEKQYVKPSVQDLKLYKYVSEKLRRSLLNTSDPYENTMTRLCAQAVQDGLICNYSVTAAEGNLTINGKDKVLGKFSIRLREDIEHRSYLVHAKEG